MVCGHPLLLQFGYSSRDNHVCRIRFHLDRLGRATVWLIPIETIAHAETCSKEKFLRVSRCVGDTNATQMSELPFGDGSPRPFEICHSRSKHSVNRRPTFAAVPLGPHQESLLNDLNKIPSEFGDAARPVGLPIAI